MMGKNTPYFFLNILQYAFRVQLQFAAFCARFGSTRPRLLVLVTAAGFK